MANINDFDYVDNFRRGLARVRQGNKWGIVNEDYEIVVPVEYDSVWKFYGKTYNNIVLEKDGEKIRVSFDQLLGEEDEPEFQEEDEPYNSWEDEPGWGSYDEYGGPNGYDDFTIDAAFEGDPDAVWNID